MGTVFFTHHGREAFESEDRKKWKCPICQWWREWEEDKCPVCGLLRDGGAYEQPGE